MDLRKAEGGDSNLSLNLYSQLVPQRISLLTGDFLAFDPFLQQSGITTLLNSYVLRKKKKNRVLTEPILCENIMEAFSVCGSKGMNSQPSLYSPVAVLIVQGLLVQLPP